MLHTHRRIVTKKNELTVIIYINIFIIIIVIIIILLIHKAQNLILVLLLLSAKLVDSEFYSKFQKGTYPKTRCTNFPLNSRVVMQYSRLIFVPFSKCDRYTVCVSKCFAFNSIEVNPKAVYIRVDQTHYIVFENKMKKV